MHRSKVAWVNACNESDPLKNKNAMSLIKTCMGLMHALSLSSLHLAGDRPICGQLINRVRFGLPLTCYSLCFKIDDLTMY